MRFATCYRTMFSLAIVLASPAFAGNDEGEGFIDGTQIHVLNRNFFFSQDYRNGDFTLNPNKSERQSLKTGLNYYRTRDSGQALAGEIDNDSWSVHAWLAAGSHGFKLSYTRIDGDTPFDYVWNTYDLQLDAASQVSDFNNPNERAWEARYDYDFAALGVPGLSLTARYVRGSDIDGTRASGAYSYFNGIEDGSHWERNLWLSYVVQSGPEEPVLQPAASHTPGGWRSQC